MNINMIKAACIAIGAFVSDLVGGLGYALVMLAVFMLIDYITGITAAGIEKQHDKGDETKGIASSRGLKGIVKKCFYIVVIGVAMGLDMLILYYSSIIGITLPISTFFGSLMTLYFVFNEMISILENCVRIGVPVPDWMIQVTNLLMIKIDKTAEKEIESIEK